MPAAGLFDPVEQSQPHSVGGGAAPGFAGAPGPGPASSLGLSQSHKWTQAKVKSLCRSEAGIGDFILTRYLGGELAQITQVGYSAPRGQGGTRGQVKGFSASSRRNMLNLVHSIDRGQVGEVLFDTKTGPPECLTWANIEQKRRLYFKRMVRKWGKSDWFAVWKKENHKSGLPHLHVLMFWRGSAARLSEYRAWADRAWAEILAPEDQQLQDKIARVCGRVELMRKWNGVNYYLAKYLAEYKNEEYDVATGRIWGVENRANLPVNPEAHVVAKPVGIRVRRTLRKLQEKKRCKYYVHSENRWHRLYDRQDKHSGRFISALDQFNQCQRLGFKVRRRRARVAFSKFIRIFQEDPDSPGKLFPAVDLSGPDQKWAREIRGSSGTSQLIPLREWELGAVVVELQAFVPGRYFISPAEVAKLHQFCVERWKNDQISEESLPF